MLSNASTSMWTGGAGNSFGSSNGDLDNVLGNVAFFSSNACHPNWNYEIGRTFWSVLGDWQVCSEPALDLLAFVSLADFPSEIKIHL